MTSKREVRKAVLDAAMRLAENGDIGALTLEAVAAHAGVSKGGLLHYFNNKEALLKAMVGRVLEKFEDDRRLAMANLPGDSGPARDAALMRAYLSRSFAGLGKDYKSGMILVAVAASQPELLAPIREYFEARTRETMAHFANPAAALAMSLLADGLWLFDALEIPPFSGQARAQVRDFMDDLARRELGAPKDNDVE